MSGPYYHGGRSGLKAGDLLVPSSPHTTDGCPICVARAAGRGVTVGEYRRWLQTQGPSSQGIIDMLADAPDDEIVDPPTSRDAVYFTIELAYARWYAARSGHGDVYEIDPVGDVQQSEEDHFITFFAPVARVKRVLERGVWLKRGERRELLRRWKKADKRMVPESVR